jgi:glyoxylase-like metal-dependent hydrolase (beta-lactamase superfamily II)
LFFRQVLYSDLGCASYVLGDGWGRTRRGSPLGRTPTGQQIDVGALRIRALATPGHRPEHLTLAVADLSRSTEPWLLLTGDSLLVGDLARPDLVLEAEAGARRCTRA